MGISAETESFVRSRVCYRAMVNNNAVWVRPRHPGGISSVRKGIVTSSALIWLILVPFTERAKAGDTITLYGSPPIVDNKISYCPLHGNSGGRTVSGGDLDQDGKCAIIITCVVSVEGDIPVSPTFELNSSKLYTAQEINESNIAVVDIYGTRYTLMFPCGPLTYRCYLRGGSSSINVTVEASVNSCVTPTPTSDIPSESSMTTGQPSNTGKLNTMSIMPPASPTSIGEDNNNATSPSVSTNIGLVIGVCVSVAGVGLMVIIGITAIILKAIHFGLHMRKKRNRRPTQAQDGGRSFVLLPELGHRDIESGYSENNDDSLNRPENATTPPEPDELVLRKEIPAVHETVKT